MPKWEVVGGGDKGGILVREGQDLKSPQAGERLATGAIVEQLELVGDRLHYKVVTGSGPPEGWVSVKLNSKELLVPKEEEAAKAPTDPAEWPAYLETVLGGSGIATTLRAGSPVISPVGKAPAKAKVRLVIFTWTGNRGGAGSAHNFNKWPKMLAEGCDADTWEVCQVNYAGRGARMKEPNATSATDVAAAVADTLADKCGSIPTVLFGFSFGAILAYETAQALVGKGCPPLGLAIASAEHPGWNGRGNGAGPSGSPTKDMEPAAFEKMLHSKGGTEVILQSEDMKKMYLPVIMADMAMEEAYGAEPPEHEKLACPVVAFRGAKCPLIPREEVDPWMEVTGCGEGTPSRVEEMATGLEPAPQAPWLCDWYLCQGEPSAAKICAAVASTFGGAQ